MKVLFACIVTALFFACACMRRGESVADDDVAAAKAAFAKMLEYQKTDDIRSTNLFSTNCLVTCTLISGKNKRTFVLSANAFRKRLEEQIALKLGNKDTYEDVSYSKNGTNVMVIATICYAGSTNRGPMVAVYGRDIDGILRIQAWDITAFSNETSDKRSDR